MKIGILGMGSIGRRHVSNLLSMGHTDLIGLDQKIDPAYDLIPVVESMDDFWHEPLDVVFVCTPPDSHFTLASLALQKRCHVFLEKPAAVDRADVVRLNAVAEIARRKVGVGYQLRFLLHPFLNHPGPRHVWIRHCQDMSTWPSTYEKDALLEFSHELDAAIFLNGTVRGVMAMHREPIMWGITLQHDQAVSTISIDASPGVSFERSIRALAHTLVFEQPATAFNDAAYHMEVRMFLSAVTHGGWDSRIGSLPEAAHVAEVIEACRESATNDGQVYIL